MLLPRNLSCEAGLIQTTKTFLLLYTDLLLHQALFCIRQELLRASMPPRKQVSPAMQPKKQASPAEKVFISFKTLNALRLSHQSDVDMENALVDLLKKNSVTRVDYDQFLKEKEEEKASAKKKKNAKASKDQGPAEEKLHENVAPVSAISGLPQPVLDALGQDKNVARILEQLMEPPEEEDEEVEKQVGKQVADPVASSTLMVMRTCETLGQKLEVALQNQGMTSVDRERYLQAKNDLVKQSLVLKEEQEKCPQKTAARKEAAKTLRTVQSQCKQLTDLVRNTEGVIETLKGEEGTLKFHKVPKATLQVQNDIKIWEKILEAGNTSLAQFNSKKAEAKKASEDARKDEDMTKCKVKTSQAVIAMGRFVLSTVVPEKGLQRFRAESIAQAVIQQLNHHILKLTTPPPALYDILADIFEYLWNVAKSGDDGCVRDLMLGNGNEDGEDGEVIDIPRPVKPAMDLDAKYTPEEFFNLFQLFLESRNKDDCKKDCKALEDRYEVKVDPATIVHTLLTQVKRAIECIKSMGKAVIARKVTPFNTASKATDAEAEAEADAEASGAGASGAGASGSGASGSGASGSGASGSGASGSGAKAKSPSKSPSEMKEDLKSSSKALSESIAALKKASNQALVKESKVVDLTLSDSEKEEGASSSSKKPQSAPKVRKASQAFQGNYQKFSDSEDENEKGKERPAKKPKKRSHAFDSDSDS
jgi:hypothetical protein